MEVIDSRKLACKVKVLSVFAMLALLFLMTACSNDDERETVRLEVSPESLYLDNNGEGILTITSNSQWHIITTVEWLSFSSLSGVGNEQVTVRVKDGGTSERSAMVLFEGETNSQNIIISQLEVPVTATEPIISSDGSVQTFNVGDVTFNMIRVEGSSFNMGATSEQLVDAESDEKPVHSVTVNSFYIGETEVTQDLWLAIMGHMPTTTDQWTVDHGLGNNCPAYGVSWYDCQEFITKLNSLTGRTFRLPTEAEWEFAARGGTKSQGYKYAGSYIINDIAWYDYFDYMYTGIIRCSEGAHDVATKQPNELGLYDMSGNVFEWCSDWYGYYSSTAQTNPIGPSTGSSRVLRGGMWRTTATTCRVSSRFRFNPQTGYYDFGFRLVLD